MNERNSPFNPLVSVVIPTRNRPTLVCRAVRSALAQTLEAIEVIVVIDGPDEETSRRLGQIDDPRLMVLPLPSWVGVGDCRNAGVQAARAPWIASLDDDDEWFPGKLEAQLRTARQSLHRNPIVVCRLISRTDSGDLCWPRRFPSPEEPLCEYLFCQKSPFGGEGFFSSSSIFAGKELLLKVPFRQCPHDDWDMVLRATTLFGAALEFVPGAEPLMIWHHEDSRDRITSTNRWQASLAWVEENRSFLTSRAYCSFLLIQVSLHAARTNDWRVFWRLLRRAFQNGKPTLADIRAHLLIWLIPKPVRTNLVIFFDILRRATE